MEPSCHFIRLHFPKQSSGAHEEAGLSALQLSAARFTLASERLEGDVCVRVVEYPLRPNATMHA